MKKAYFLLSFLIILTACTKNKEEEKETIKNTAEEFLREFYYNNFEYTKSISDQSTKDFIAYIEKKDRQEYRSQHFNAIDSVQLLTKDTAFVYYQYENSYSKKDKHVLPLIKVNGTWLVHIENKNNSDFYRYVFDYSLKEIEIKNYKELNNEEIVEIDLFMTTFIKQVNHPKLVVGLIGLNSIFHYDIDDLENYDNKHSYFWNDLSTLSTYVYLEFENEVLSELEYFISDIESSNSLGVFKKMETILIKEYGEPYNNQYLDKENWYQSIRWFVKGKNEIIELLNNENETISLLVTESEPVFKYNY